jgi:16S rRNA (guanine527-N7)-methyltransferase
MCSDAADSSGTPTGATLADALLRHDIALPADHVARLEQYCQRLWEWNEKLNLTRHTSFEKFVSRDVVDSSQLSRLLQGGEKVLDVGSGGGVPGVVLAILRSDLQISLCESVGKKATALQSIVESLGLATPVHHCRGEQLLVDARFDAVVARAVGPLWKILKWFHSCWAGIGRLLVIKGPRWVEERGEARHRGLLRDLELRRAATYSTPGTDVENVILEIWPKS